MTYIVNDKCIKCNNKWLELNNKYSEIWPNINKKIDPLEDHEKHTNEENKFEKYFKENV